MQKLFFFLAILISQTLIAQNVGIGITTPLVPLHISTGASGNITPFSPLVVEGNTNTYINLLSPNSDETGLLFGKADNAASGGIVYNSVSTLNGFQFRTAGNITQMILNSVGNLGIGTMNPQKNLSVQNGMNIDQANGNTGSVINTITFGNESGEGIGSKRNAGGNQYGLDFFTSSTAKMSISNSGNVGIGTTTPGFPLNFGAALGDKISLFGSSGNNYGFGIQNNLLQIHASAVGEDIAFGYGSSSSFSETMRIKGNGNVGIGNSNPAYQLDINNRMRIRSGGNNSVSAGLWLNNNSNTEAAFIGMEDDTHVGFYGVGTGWKFGMNTQTGALKINGSDGQAGQVLTSNAGGAASSWDFPIKTYQWLLPNYTITTTETSIFTQNVTATTNCSLIITAQFGLNGSIYAAGGGTASLFINGIRSAEIAIKVDGNYYYYSSIALPNFIFNGGPGTHSVEIRVSCNSASGNMTIYPTHTSGAAFSYVSVIQIAR